MAYDKRMKLALILSNLVLFIYLVYRLINQSKILDYFPLDITNDISSHIAQLYFLKECGFHNLCGYWYNGYTLFKFYPPGWFFFSYPLLLIFKRPETATYISIILMLIISFVVIYKIIKLKEKSFLMSSAFFLFLFGSATSVSAFFRLGRVTELFAWTVFLILTYFILKYKDRELDFNFIYFIPFYAVLLFSHPTVAIIYHFFLASLFLVKLNKKEFTFLTLSVLAGILLSSFWWYPFVTDLGNESRTYEFLPELTNRFFEIYGQWTSTVILITVLPLICLIMFYVYYISKNRDKKELLFYSPILLLCLLVITRLCTLIPYLNFVYPEPYFPFFMIFILIFLFNLDFDNLPGFIKRIIPFAIFLVICISVIMSFFVTSYYQEHTDLERNTLGLLKEVNGTYIIVDPPASTSYAKAYYSYGAIYLNLSTPSGWSTSELTEEHNQLLISFDNAFKNRNCGEFQNSAKKLKLENIIAYNENCEFNGICNFKEKVLKGNACLLRV